MNVGRGGRPKVPQSKSNHFWRDRTIRNAIRPELDDLQPRTNARTRCCGVLKRFNRLWKHECSRGSNMFCYCCRLLGMDGRQTEGFEKQRLLSEAIVDSLS